MADTPQARSTVSVVLAYSPAAGQVCECVVTVPAQATVADVLAASGVDMAAVQAVRCGIWGRAGDLQTRVQAGDRVELYRPLAVDPKVARRERFVQQGARRSGLFARRRPNSKAGY